MNDTNPAAHTGSPQAAVAEATGAPSLTPVDLDVVHKGERLRTAGLLWPMPEDIGGGYLRLRPASVTAVSTARDDHERKIRKMPKVKQKFKPTDNLTGKPGTELNRFTVVMAMVEWEDCAPLIVGGKTVNVSALGEVELREFFSENFLPELDLGSDAPPELELNMTVLMHVLEGLDEVSRVPSQEIAAGGKDFKLGLAGNTDYSG